MSRATGLLRESVMARLFGAGLTFDAFMLGFRIPNLSRDLFAEGALSSAFVPTFAEYLTTRSKEEAARLVNVVATALVLVVGTVCVAGIVFAPPLVRLLEDTPRARVLEEVGARLRRGLSYRELLAALLLAGVRLSCARSAVNARMLS